MFGKIDHMSHPSAHPDDPHYVTRNSWLRAAVLGANDGIVSVSSLVVGVAPAEPDGRMGGWSLWPVWQAWWRGQCRWRRASTSRCRRSRIRNARISSARRSALRDMPAAELEELVEIYRLRGLTEETARKVAHELSEHDALGAHIRDELGLSEFTAPTRLKPPLLLASPLAWRLRSRSWRQSWHRRIGSSQWCGW